MYTGFMNSAALLDDCKLHCRIDFSDDDSDLLLMLTASAADVAHAANVTLPADVVDLPDDLRFAILDQVAMLYDARGNSTDRPTGLSLAASRICARYRGVSAGTVV